MARGEPALGFWWHINSHAAYKKLMLQGYFLAMDHFYICDKFTHGPMEKDEVATFPDLYVMRWLSHLLKRASKKQIEC